MAAAVHFVRVDDLRTTRTVRHTLIRFREAPEPRRSRSRPMKKSLPFIVLALGVLYAASSLGALRNPTKYTEFDIVGFGKLPVVTNGRVKPLDTVARTSLLLFQGRQSVAIPGLPEQGFFEKLRSRFSAPQRRSVTPTEWLLDVVFHPEKADTYRTFEIVHPELLSVFGLQPEDGDGNKRFSFSQLQKSV